MKVNTYGLRCWFERWIGWRITPPAKLPCGHKMPAWEYRLLIEVAGLEPAAIDCRNCG